MLKYKAQRLGKIYIKYRWHDNYSGAPTDGSSWEPGSNDFRVMRGGSWYNIPIDCRSATCHYYSPFQRLRAAGFRVAVASISV
ncbi:MAG: SUMF1/EgtB/PvdO family nonheme iron enzyme [Oscillatoriaceae cyanobacterium Prado104]|nr:SUMF1/EgtB/PvdO family nonheme iron enzyme [Oscillatoriaceae cyanobacterium Prado104]